MNEKNPKTSIIMPVYNGEKFLRDSIISTLSQTDQDFELLIADDGSTDKTEEIIKSFNDPRIKYFKRNHEGVFSVLNFLIEQSNGKFIARMDADDISNPDRLKKQIYFLESNPEFSLVGSWATIINDKGEEKGLMDYPPNTWENIKKYTFLHCPFIHPTVVFKKEMMEKVGAYKEKYKHIEDYELWTRIVFKYKCFNIHEPLIKYRIHSSQLTKKNNLKMKLEGILVRLLAIWRFIKS